LNADRNKAMTTNNALQYKMIMHCVTLTFAERFC